MSLSRCKHSNKILLITGFEMVFRLVSSYFKRCPTNVGRERISKYSKINRKWWQGWSIHSKGRMSRVSRFYTEMDHLDLGDPVKEVSPWSGLRRQQKSGFVIRSRRWTSIVQVSHALTVVFNYIVWLNISMAINTMYVG